MDPSAVLSAPTEGDEWLGLTRAPLPVGTATDWAIRPDCGAVVTFCGTARDHAPGRPGVTELEYEAYESQVVPRLAAIVAETRRRWDIGRLALLHRIGPVAVGESSVVVVASSAHRPEAFAAARFAIDRLKATVPIWKREAWEGGEDWGLDATPLDPADEHAVPPAAPVTTAAGATATVEPTA